MPYKNPAQKKEYQRQWHQRTWQKRKEKHYCQQTERRHKLAKWFLEYKKTLFCCKCGETHPACIEFHHTEDNKKNNVSDMVTTGYSKEMIMDEIKKCIIICKNCHAKEHYQNKE